MKTNTNTNGLLDFQDPGMLPNELMDMPGFVNELKEHTLRVAPRPNEPLAFAGALAMLAHLTGRSTIDETGAHTNLYLAALAPTGMGKDEARTTNKRLAAAAGILPSVPDAIASGEGLEDAVAANPSLLLQSDEADTLLCAMRGGDSRAARLNEMVLRFFSEAKSSHAMRLKAGQGTARVIPLPHLTLFATGIPEFVYGALTDKALRNGLLGRCLFIESNDFMPLGEQVKKDLPPVCVETAKALAAREKRFTDSGALDPLVITFSAAAKTRIGEARQHADDLARNAYENDLKTAAALYCRLFEKTMKLANLRAVSRNPLAPLLTDEDVLWGERLARHLTEKMLFEAQFHVAEGKFDALVKRFLGLLKKAGGTADRRTLLKNMHIDTSTFSRITRTLHMADLIEEEQIDCKKVLFTIK